MHRQRASSTEAAGSSSNEPDTIAAFIVARPAEEPTCASDTASSGSSPEIHALGGDDAVHLAAALLVGADVLTSADTALCDAASAKGIAVANPLSPP